MIKRDSTISIIRVLAMISIIAGHVFAWENINTYQLLSIGVEIFLLFQDICMRTKILIQFWPFEGANY